MTDGKFKPDASTSASEAKTSDAPTTLRLFMLCLKVGILSFGGGLSGWLYREFVQRRGWMTDQDFASSLAFSQMMPGPTITNLIICCTSLFIAPSGVFFCVLAMFIGPFFAVIGLYQAYGTLSHYMVFQYGSTGIVFAAIGMMLIIAIRGIRRTVDFPPGLLVIAATATSVGVLKWPMLPVAFCLSLVSVALAWRKL